MKKRQQNRVGKKSSINLLVRKYSKSTTDLNPVSNEESKHLLVNASGGPNSQNRDITRSPTPAEMCPMVFTAHARVSG